MEQKVDVRDIPIFKYTNDVDSSVSVIIVHGYAEHCMRYGRFIDQLTDAGIRVLTYDQRGHGKSGGARVMVNHFDDFAADLNEIANSFFKQGDHNFIYGHSMGGLVLLRYLQIYGDGLLKGGLISGVALKPDDSIPKILIKISTLVAKILPNLPTIKLDGTAVSRDPAEVKKYNEDPLNYRGGTKAKFGDEFLKAMIQAKEELSKITLPFVIHHGTADRLIDPESSKWVYDGIASENKTIRMWDGLYHELLNELEKDAVGTELIAWIEKHAKA